MPDHDIIAEFFSKPFHPAPTDKLTVQVWGINRDWNDFGFKSRCAIHITENNKVIYECKGTAAIFSKDQFEGINDFFLESPQRNPLKATSDAATLFVILDNYSTYRDLVKTLGVEKSQSILNKINDLVYLSSIGDSEHLPKIVNSRIFSHSLTRSSDSYFAFRNAAPLLHGLDFEVGSTSQENISTVIPNSNGHHPVVIDFKFRRDEEIDLPISVVIGENGLGKTQALGNLARRALKGDMSQLGIDLPRISVNRIIALTTSKRKSSAFPQNNYKRPKVWYRLFSLTEDERGQASTASLIVDLMRSSDLINGVPRGDLFLSGISSVNDWSEICLTNRDGSSIRIKEIFSLSESRRLDATSGINLSISPKRSVNGKLVALSSGESVIVRASCLISLQTENGSLILLDEPETHLHPQFINRLMFSLYEMLRLTRSSAIIATHSVYVVRETPGEQVHVLQFRNKEKSITTPGIATLGADVGELSYFVFGENEPSLIGKTVTKQAIDTKREGRLGKFGRVLSGSVLSKVLEEK